MVDGASAQVSAAVEPVPAAWLADAVATAEMELVPVAVVLDDEELPHPASRMPAATPAAPTKKDRVVCMVPEHRAITITSTKADLYR
jgi:hypothetical protein